MIVIGSLRGSPGVTTLVLALATMHDAPTRLVVEADPGGGVLAARFGLGCEPGLLTLAGVRRDLDDVELDAHLQRLDGGVRVLCGPSASEPATAALRTSRGTLAARLARRSEPVFVDVGRLGDGDVVDPFLAAARHVLVVARPRLDELQALAPRLDRVRAVTAAPIRVVLVGERPYRAADVAAMVAETAAVAVVPPDERAAAALNGARALGPLALRRSPLLRAASRLAQDLAAEAVSAVVPA